MGLLVLGALITVLLQFLIETYRPGITSRIYGNFRELFKVPEKPLGARVQGLNDTGPGPFKMKLDDNVPEKVPEVVKADPETTAEHKSPEIKPVKRPPKSKLKTKKIIKGVKK